jgi:hypothetical protein
MQFVFGQALKQTDYIVVVLLRALYNKDGGTVGWLAIHASPFPPRFSKMLHQALQFNVRNAIRIVVCCVCALTFAVPVPAYAQVNQDGTSLQIVPQDVAFYMALLRNKEQYDLVLKSKAFAALLEIPFVKQMTEQSEALIDSAPGEAKDLFDLPENQELKEVLIDLISDEVFIYGGEGYADILRLQKTIYNQMFSESFKQGFIEGINQSQDGPVTIDVFDPDDAFDPDDPIEDDAPIDPQEREMQRAMLKFLQENSEELKVPDTVIGFKVSAANKDAVNKQLSRLEEIISEAMQAAPPQLTDAFARKRIAGADFLTFSVDGSMIPWKEFNWKEEIAPLEDEPGEFDDIPEKLKKVKFTICLGIYKNHLIIYFGESSDYIENLADAALLLNSEKAAPLRKLTDKSIVSVYYVSDAFSRVAASGKEQLDSWMSMFDLAIEADTEAIPEELKPRIRKDLKEFVEDIKVWIPEPGAVLATTIMTDRGYSRLTYQWAESLTLDGTQPLSILNHVGGDPIAFVASRRKGRLEQYKLLAKWMGRLNYYSEEYGLGQLEGEELEQVKLYMAAIKPYLTQLDSITSKMLIPAFEDGQSAIVLDSKLSSKQWHAAMPPSETPLPMFELALVFGISDADLLKSACRQYVQLINEAYVKIRELLPEEQRDFMPPEFQVPLPSTRTFENEGTFYWYRFPEVAGADRQIIPTAGLSDRFLTLALNAKHARRLLSPATISQAGPLGNANRPLAAASYFSFARLIDTLHPWIEYGIEAGAGMAGPLLGAAGGVEPTEPPDVKPIIDQVRSVLLVLKSFRGYSSVTYVDGDAMVTHSEWHFQDLE